MILGELNEGLTFYRRPGNLHFNGASLLSMNLCCFSLFGVYLVVISDGSHS